MKKICLYICFLTECNGVKYRINFKQEDPARTNHITSNGIIRTAQETKNWRRVTDTDIQHGDVISLLTKIWGHTNKEAAR
jgi:SH3-like domain-containing protein